MGPFRLAPQTQLFLFPHPIGPFYGFRRSPCFANNDVPSRIPRQRTPLTFNVTIGLSAHPLAQYGGYSHEHDKYGEESLVLGSGAEYSDFVPHDKLIVSLNQ